MTRNSTYLDYNATTPLKPAATAAMHAAMDVIGNPSSVHGFGRAARKIVEDARAAIAHNLGVRPAQVVFTSGGTEANHLALLSRPQMPCFISAVEHDCVLAARSDAIRIPVDANGIVNTTWLEAELKKLGKPALVAVMLANNETGVIQPIKQVADIVHAHGGLLHVDAAQAFGKVPMNMILLDADTLTLSAHKCGGPKGVGALVLRDNIGIEPMLRGGGQEQRRRSGTENVIGIAGFGAAVGTFIEDLVYTSHLIHWRKAFEEKILSVAPHAVIYGRDVQRLPNTSYIAMPGVTAETQLMAFDLDGIAVSTGAACSSGKVKPSHVLQAMGIADTAAGEAVRISSGFATQARDYEAAAAAWLALYQRKQVA
ncbi:MAG: cysteine desulfurase family protein [Bdellovibrionales bacterium]